MIRRSFISCLIFISSICYGTETNSHKASYQVVPIIRWIDGSVEAINQATVSAETKGRVAKILFDIGDYVSADSIIVMLVPNEQREQLNQAEAKLLETQANFDAETKEFQRIDEIYKKNIVSKSDWDKANARLNIAKAQVSSAEANLKNAKEQLSYTNIRAPYSGVVSARHVELGEAVQPGSPLMSGFDPSAMRIVVSLPQTIANTVRKVNKAQILNINNQEIIPNNIIVYPVADANTGTVKTRLILDADASKLLHPGEYVKVGFTLGEAKRLLIPIQSVVHHSEVSGVYVVKNKLLNLRQIRLGAKFKDKIEVLSGLEEGEEIALDPIQTNITINHPKKI